MAGVVLSPRFPRARIVRTALRNAVRYLFRGAARNWVRNISSNAPALGSMTLLLLLAGVVGIFGFAMASLASAQAQDASVLHVYLRDDATASQLDSLHSKLASDSRVLSVLYVSKAQALASAQRRPGLPELAQASDSNPFPASFDAQLKQVSDVAAVDASVRHDPAVDPVYPTSYDAEAYARVQTLMLWTAIIGGAFLLLLGFVAVTVTANSIRAAIFARRDEVEIMQLVGAPAWMVRGPFVIEGALTGAVAGGLAGLITLGVTLAAIEAGAGSFVQIAPGLTVTVALLAALIVFVAGLGLGSGSSLLGLRRHLEA